MIDGNKSEQDAGDAAGSPVAAKRGRGRPSKGEPVLIRLSAEERAFADSLGKGVAAEGVRMALNAVRLVGIEAVLDLSKAAASAQPASAAAGRNERPKSTPLPVLFDITPFSPLPIIDMNALPANPVVELVVSVPVPVPRSLRQAS